MVKQRYECVNMSYEYELFQLFLKMYFVWFTSETTLHVKYEPTDLKYILVIGVRFWNTDFSNTDRHFMTSMYNDLIISFYFIVSMKINAYCNSEVEISYHLTTMWCLLSWYNDMFCYK